MINLITIKCIYDSMSISHFIKNDKSWIIICYKRFFILLTALLIICIYIITNEKVKWIYFGAFKLIKWNTSSLPINVWCSDKQITF